MRTWTNFGPEDDYQFFHVDSTGAEYCVLYGRGTENQAARYAANITFFPEIPFRFRIVDHAPPGCGVPHLSGLFSRTSRG